MRIFVTGASGWIGSAVVPELLGAGHDVVGLARSEASEHALEAAGAFVQRGDLDDPDGLAKAAADSDGVIHLAFQHDVAFGGNFAAAGGADRRAVEAMGAALADSDRPFVLASGLLGVTAGRVATEDDGLVPGAEIRANPAGIRAATALLTLSLRGVGVRSSVLRLPPTVHGDGDNGFMAIIAGIARQRAWPGMWGTEPTAGRQCTVRTPPAWPASPSKRPRPDRSCTQSATRVLRSATSPTRWVVTSPSRPRLWPPPTPPSTSPLWVTSLAWTAPPSAAQTRELLGWEPTGPTLLEDLEQDHYYREV